MEKAYKTMKHIGVGNIVLGSVMIAAGVASGVMTIIGGARLLKYKRELTF